MLIALLALAIDPAQIPPAKRCRELLDASSQALISIRVEVTDPRTGAVTLRHGTGFVVSERGYILTNSHLVASDGIQHELIFSGSLGSQHSLSRQLTLVGHQDDIDVAILQFKDSSLVPKPLPIGEPGNEPEGSELCSFGFPAELELVPVVGNLESRERQMNQWWLTSLPISDGESGSPVFDSASGRVIGIRVGDRDDLHSSYVIPLYLANSLYHGRTGLQLRSSMAENTLTAALVKRVLQSHIAAVKQHDFDGWIQILSSYENDREKEQQETPKIAWPQLERERKNAYKEAFDWVMGFNHRMKLGDDSVGFPLIAAREAELLEIDSSDSPRYADIRLTYDRTALSDWYGRRNVRCLVVRLQFEKGKIKTTLSKSVPLTALTGPQYSNIVNYDLKVITETISYFP